MAALVRKAKDVIQLTLDRRIFLKRDVEKEMDLPCDV